VAIRLVRRTKTAVCLLGSWELVVGGWNVPTGTRSLFYAAGRREGGVRARGI
jgi:hypothetical protein